MQKSVKNGLMLLGLLTITQCTQKGYISTQANYEIIQLIADDCFMPYFVDNEKIHFYRKNANYTWSIYETDTLGSYVSEIFDGRSIEGYTPKEDFTFTKIAYTMLDTIFINLQKIILLDTITTLTELGIMPVFSPNVFVYNYKTGTTNKITQNGCNRFIRWIGLDSMIIASGSEDTIQQILRDMTRVNNKDTTYYKLDRFIAMYELNKYRLFSIADTQPFLIIPSTDFSLLKQEPRIPIDQISIDALSNSEIVKLHTIHGSIEHGLESISNETNHPYFKCSDNSICYVIGRSDDYIILEHDYKHKLTKQEVIDIVLINTIEKTWQVLAKEVFSFRGKFAAALEKDKMANVKIGKNYILFKDKNKIAKKLFDGSYEQLATLSESTKLYGMSESPNDRMWVFYAYIDKNKHGLFLIRRK